MSAPDIEETQATPDYLDRAIAAVLAADPVAAAAALVYCENPDRDLAGVTAGIARMAPGDRDGWLDAPLEHLDGRTPRDALQSRDWRLWLTLRRNMPDWPALYAAQRAEFDQLLDGMYPTKD